MYKRWNENKGITLTSLVILIVVLLIVSSVMILNIDDKYNSQKLDKLASDLQLLSEKTNIYYAQYKEYPITTNSAEIKIDENIITVQAIDLSKIDGLTLNYGRDPETDDYYAIDTRTGVVYYKRGIEGIHCLAQADVINRIDIVKITKQPQWQSAIQGSNVTFSIEVENEEDITYQWFVINTYEGEGTAIEGENSNTLTIKNVATNKFYYCEVTYKDEITKKSEIAKLEVVFLEPVLAGEYTGDINKIYIDSKGDVAVIPAGFTVSNVKTNTVDETTISGGLVIYSGDHSKVTDMITVQGIANQYVWIPVENPSDIYGILESPVDGIEGTKFGKLYFKTQTNPNSHYNWPTETGYSKTGYKEPAYLANSTSGDDSTYNKDEEGNKIITQAGIQKEFNEMITSVEKYKGFYIGRYELTSTDGTINTANVVKDASPLVTKNWYNFYKACTNLEKGNVEATDKVRTSMIWGCQWDQAVKKCLIFDDKFLTDNSAKYGVYSGNGTSGVQVSATKDAAYNIYDMGGNVWDWTFEANNTVSRTGRGGDYDNSSTSDPASYRYNFSPSVHGSSLGCRSQLYIK